MDYQHSETDIQQKTKTGVFFIAFAKSTGFFIGLTLVYLIVFIAFKGRNVTSSNELLKNSQTQLPSTTMQSEVVNNQTNSDTYAPVQDNNSTSSDSNAVAVDLNKIPQSVEEIVAYYNTAHSKVKSQAKSVTRTYDNVSNYKDVIETGNSKMIASIGKKVMDTYMKENTQPVVYEGTAAINENFPPANSACNLKPSDVASAECIDKGSYYEITIHAKPEVDPKEGYGAGALATIITKEQITDAVKGYLEISNIICDYDDVYVIAQVEKSSGNMQKLYVCNPLYLNLTALGMDCKVGVQFENKWEVNW